MNTRVADFKLGSIFLRTTSSLHSLLKSHEMFFRQGYGSSGQKSLPRPIPDRLVLRLWIMNQ